MHKSLYNKPDGIFGRDSIPRVEFRSSSVPVLSSELKLEMKETLS